MKFVFTGDVHLSRYSQDKIIESSNLPERLHYIKKSLYEMADYCIANDIDKVVIGGDTLHGKSIIYAIAQEVMLQYFDDYPNLTFYVIDGNHDLSGKGNDVVSALRPLETISNVKWIPYTETYEEDGILFVPYSTGMTEIIKSNQSKVLVSHFGLSEGMLNSGMSIISNISMKDLQDKYELVLLGHYHKPQEINQNDVRLFYVGSPIQLDWGEKNDDKRFLVVDSDTLDVESVSFTSYKKHIELELTNENREDVLKIANEAKENGDYVKIVMKEKVDIDDIKKEFNIIDKTEKDVTDRGITSNMSTKDIMERYLEIREIPEKDWELYMNVGMEIKRKADESVI